MRLNLYHGWYIVLSGAVLGFIMGTIYVYGFTAFVNPIIATFGWSMAEISLGTSLRSLETGIFNPLFGSTIDRFSPRLLMVLGVILMAAGLFCLSAAPSLIMFYLAFLILGLGSTFCMGMMQTTLIAKWFKRGMGKATGVYYTGVAAGGLLVPLIVVAIDTFSWQTTLSSSALVFFVIGIPLSLFYRNPGVGDVQPVEGGLDDSTERKKLPYVGIQGFTVKDAVKTKIFWFYNIVTACQSAVLATVSIFIIPYLVNLGFSRENASLCVTMYTFVTMATRIPVGMLADRFTKKFVIAFTLGLLGIGLFIFWNMDGQSPFWLLVIFAVLIGSGLSGLSTLRGPVIAQYFGTKHFGAIFGLSSLSITLGGVLSTPFAGWIFDTFHSYKPWWLALLLLVGISILLMLAVPRPTEKTTS